MQREILQVVETAQSVYFMGIVYEEGDIGGAVGNIYAFSGERQPGIVPTQVLATNDTLRVMWASPSGTLWVGSADGNIGTTAPVSWQAPTKGGDYVTMGGSPAWSVTALPRVRATGLLPNVTALWGTADDDVFAGTDGGHIYHWDGSNWQQVHEGPDDGNETIRAFGGASRRDVFAVAADATILHFDGSVWGRVPLPAAPSSREVYTAVSPLPGGGVLIAGVVGGEGRLLHDTAAGLAEFGRYPLQLIDMAVLDDRVLFATGDGVAERFGRDVRMIKSSFRTASMSKGVDRLFFIEPAQEGPRYIEFDPRKGDAPWWRFTF